MKTYTFLISTKEFDRIKSGEQKEFYRLATPYWQVRFQFDIWNTRPFDHITFITTKKKQQQKIIIALNKIRIDKPNILYTDGFYENESCYCLELGEVLYNN